MRLFDCRKLDDQHASDEDFMRFGARMSAYTANFRFGPIAFVATLAGCCGMSSSAASTSRPPTGR